MSSQTTDTPGTTTSKQTPWIAPEQLLKLTRFRGALQIGIFAIHAALNRPHPHPARQQANHFQAVRKGGWPLFFRFSGGDSENNTRPQAGPQIRRQESSMPPKTRNVGVFGGTRRVLAGLRAITSRYGLAHMLCAPQLRTFRVSEKSASRGVRRYCSSTPGPQAAVPTPRSAWSTYR